MIQNYQVTLHFQYWTKRSNFLHVVKDSWEELVGSERLIKLQDKTLWLNRRLKK